MWLAGLVSVAFGVILVARPGLGIATLVWLIGLYTIVFGIIETIAAFRLKGAAGRLAHRTA
jgi:uncharacterized membrane protein HdeD (DUF308 family)